VNTAEASTALLTMKNSYESQFLNR